MEYDEVFTHGKESDERALLRAERTCSKKRFVNGVTPIEWKDGKCQYIITEEPKTHGDMRLVYFLDA